MGNKALETWPRGETNACHLTASMNAAKTTIKLFALVKGSLHRCVCVYVCMLGSWPHLCHVDGLCTVCVSRRDVLLCSRATSTAAAIVGTCRALGEYC